MTLIVKPGFNGMTDADAIAYVNAVEAADGQPLEFGVGKAINDFVVGCKLDGTWSAIKASCILAGARTLAGALIPLVGAAPTNFNFVSGDYNRKMGLGDGSNTSKYLDTNRAENVDPQDSVHLSVHVSETFSAGGFILSGTDGANATSIYRATGVTSVYSRSSTLSASVAGATGFVGFSRSGASSTTARLHGTTVNSSVASNGRNTTNYRVFSSPSYPSSFYGKGRASFYSIGESLNIALLDARVTALITAFGVAIP